ncbi:WD40 repeat domain-containing serine/threonine-protein kinase [Actinophytocola xanthii]|uniref:non-specific serine/threonine protein kinase n=1 Tax=Actinophytocola xanthii TaxID=1912961 RepID=A0A1Q8CYF8_9PSEU|nr:WD40 repeat domain-containing serine/threonine-protein kinase [Actinophytocola xanthii]OLF19388.1 hypothetical protein BU204_00195 [Actinophytocola xanthii]
MVDAVPELGAPEMFGPYRLDGVLGRGGMGEVYRAYDTVHRRTVALKRLPGFASEEFRARFRRESRIVGELRHPHVVPINDHGEIDGLLYLDMRLVDGPDLRRLLADGPLEPARAVGILTQVASALDAAHARGVLHRDVKPANVLLDSSGTAYLADFGIARSLAADVTRLTETGDYIGTLDYMAPERLVRSDVDAASDVYSLACVLFQCLTGRVPFPAQDSASKLAAQLNDPPPAPSLFDRAIPPAMDLVVGTGMDKDPRRRYPSAGELMAAAAAVLAEPPTATVIPLPVAGDPGQGYFVQLLATAVGRPDADVTRTSPDRCPYPGLQSFGAADSGWFFGRAQAVRDLLARLAGQRPESGPLLVVGASGAGKSSLLHAGLLAAHARGDAEAPRLAMTPGERPVMTLAARLAALTGADPQGLAWRLYQRPAVFGELCRAAAARSSAPLLVAVDQLEELFTHCADAREREAFATALANAWPARVVLAVRADFVEHCIALAPLAPALAAPYVLGPLSAGELVEVITGPAGAAGLTLEPGLVDRLITDVDAGRDPGALPRLAHALRETWHNRSGTVLTLAGYQATGGVDRAVALTADGVYMRLDEQDRRALRTAMLRMVTLLDGGGIARRRAHRGELPPRLLENLVATRLVTVDRDHVTLSHDALLTAWPRLREWVAEDRQGLLVRQRLREAAAGWWAGGRDRGDLYRGARLAAALEWSGGRSDLTPEEWAFLQASDRDRRRTTRRLRTLVAALATLLVVALTAGVIAVISRNDAQHERDQAFSRQLAAESLSQASVDPVGAMRSALHSWRAGQTPEARGAVLSAPLLSFPAEIDAGVDRVIAADVSPDGSLIAVSSSDGRVGLWDAAARRRLETDIAGSGSVVAVRFSPDGTLLAVSSLDSDSTDASGVVIWEVPSGRRVRRLSDVNPAFGPLAWRPDGKGIAATSVTADNTPGIAEWDPRTGNLIRWVAPGGNIATSLAYHPRGDRLAIGRADGTIDLWDPATATRVSTRADHRDNTTDRDGIPIQLTMSPAGDLLASASVSDNMIRFWNARTGAPVREMADVTRHSTDPGQGPSSITFSADGATLYTNSDPDTISVWDPGSASYQGGLPPGPRDGSTIGGTVLAVAVAADGRTRIAAKNDGTVLRWSTNRGWHTEPGGAVTGLAFTPDGSEVTAGDAEGSLYSWDVATGERTAEPAHVDGGVFAVRYTRPGVRITASLNATFTATPPPNGIGVPHTVTLAGREFRGAIAVSPDGRWLAAAHEAATTAADAPEDNRIHVWDAETLTERAEFELGPNSPVELAFSPDGDQLLALTNSPFDQVKEGVENDDSEANMMTWQVPSFSGPKRRPLGDDTLLSVVYGAGGDTLVTGGTTGRIQLRDAVTGELREEFGEHPSIIRQLAISPDGRLVASVTTEDSLVRLWDVERHELVAVLHGHGAAPNQIEFSADGKRLTTGGTDTDVGVWHVDPEAAAEELCASLTEAGVPDPERLC